MNGESWVCVRVTHHTWAQEVVSRHRSRNTAETVAGLLYPWALIARLWGARHTYEAWRDA